MGFFSAQYKVLLFCVKNIVSGSNSLDLYTPKEENI